MKSDLHLSKPAVQHPTHAVQRPWQEFAAVMSLLLLVIFATGCATSTIEKRKVERSVAYNGLPESTRALVDHGQIQVGMPMDAVYIAWGKPNQQTTKQTEEGTLVTWVYHETQLEGYHHWAYRLSPTRYGYYSEPYWAYDYYPRTYVSAEIYFKDGVVKEWRTLPYPVY